MGETAFRIIQYSELERWDVKYFAGRIKSKYPLVSLAELVTEHNEKIRPFKSPDETFKILGVNNVDGIFHSYDALGKEIRQPYKKVSSGDFAYNPYRVNVGSIGWVPPEHDGAYISPAYVVFSVDSSVILPEVFWFILKSDFFNQTLRAATAGSVRMNLTYPLLKTLKIPVPPLPIQQKILTSYSLANNQLSESLDISKSIEVSSEQQFIESLGLKKPKRTTLPKIICSSFKEIDRWSLMFNQLASVGANLEDGKYTAVQLSECLDNTANGYSVKPSKKQTNYKILKLSALQPHGLDLSESKNVDISEKIAERFYLKKGDLLICRSVGSFSHVAKSALVEDDQPGIIFPDIIIRARFNESILPEYAREVIQSSVGRAWFQQNARTAVGMWKIGGSDIAAFPMPLPTLSVQQKLVKEVVSAREKAQNIRETANRTFANEIKLIEKMILDTRSVEAH
ncbi:MAG: restriction endonuclease subunit S [Geobacteraceae bacterium]|nr:restriction endonuclease subunit S [Geobacteraceae bacterium]